FQVTRKDAVQAVEGGKQQLSLAYNHDKVKESGTYKGMPYDIRQTNIKYNHLAIVDTGRAGAVASINLDSDDAVLIIDEQNIIEEVKEMSELKTINLDSVDYQADIAVINALKEAEKNLDSVNIELENGKENFTKLQANFDSQKDKIDQLEKEISESKNLDADEIKNLVNARVELVSTAKGILDEEKNLDDMEDIEIKKAVILARFPSANLDEKDSVYIDARFDSALEIEVDKTSNTKTVHGTPSKNVDSAVSAKSSYDKMCDELYGGAK
ncbi:MAG: DUF2213 domain-containing protein, partial [bacterium]|nr:DUF2213 domain-containing protein [bacterium]